MKYLRVRCRPDPSVRPVIFELLADAPYVTETRVVDWNLGDDALPTVLFSITGDVERVRSEIDDVDAADDWDITPIDDKRFYLHLRVDPVPIIQTVVSALSADGLLVIKPVLYREGNVHARLVGKSTVLQNALESMPSVIDIDVQEIGEYTGKRTTPVSTLSDRQREAVEAALDLGYYDQPRNATHKDVADRLGCAPSTTSEHLQKAEAKLVRAGMTDERRVTKASERTDHE